MPPEVFVIASHPLATSTLAEYLSGQLDVSVGHCSPNSSPRMLVGVLLAAHEEEDSVPRIVRELIAAGVRVVVAYDSTRTHRDILVAALRLGVWGAYDIRSDPGILIDQVQAARAGRRWVQDWQTAEWMSALKRDESGLTPRERALLEALYAESPPSLRAAAERTGITEGTARVHLANVRRKLVGQHTGNLSALHHALVSRGWL